MPVETFQRPVRTPVRMPVAAAPPRLRPKGPVAPDFSRQSPAVVAVEARPRQSAVARLEADKAKYVKSQVALSKQQPLRPPDVSVRHRPLTTSPAAGANLRPTRKTPTQPKPKPDGAQQLDLQHLSNLISGVGDAGPKERPSPAPRPDWSSPAKVRLKASVPPPPPPPAVENTGVSGSQAAAAAAGTVRRVDVMPQAGPARAPCRRPQLLLRPPLQPLPLPPHPLFPLRPAPSHLRLLHLRTPPPASSSPSPLKPAAAVGPVKPDNNPTPPSLPPPLPPPPPPPTAVVFPPPSPAFTRLSSGGSRKRPSLTRSKSDMSDRFSRAGTELERFFNLCGLDPADLQEFTGSSSDIVSLARFRSVSAPGSEVAAGDGEEEEQEEEEQPVPNAAEARVPYGVSVIERNARVIKWLYGLRQARDINAARSTNL